MGDPCVTAGGFDLQEPETSLNRLLFHLVTWSAAFKKRQKIAIFRDLNTLYYRNVLQ